MKKNKLHRRSLSALLAVIMALTLVPAAAASPAIGVCQKCGGTMWDRTVLKEANCHETGVIKYVCTNPRCDNSVLEEIRVDSSNHDMVYTDNGDGTHSGVCREHPKQTVAAATHRFVNGICEQCGAPNYSDVVMDLPVEKRVPVALGDTSAKLSAGNIRLTLGSANITDEYDLNYFWYDYSQGGRPVGEGQEYPLPASVYGKKGTYQFTLVVSASHKGSVKRDPPSQTCRFVVEVDELVTASAVITTDDSELLLGDTDGWSVDSVSNQIYDAVQNLCGRGVQPDYVCFNDLSVSNVGKLNVTSTHDRYYFGGTARDLEDVRFIVGEEAGDFVVGFTAYDTDGESYAGVLTITVQQYTGDMDVLYIAARNGELSLSAKDFEDFWEDVCPGGVLEYICFDQLPRSVDGTLYTEYETSYQADPLRLKDELYVEPERRQYAIDNVVFVPSVGVKQTSYITLNFTGYGTRSTGRDAERKGVIYIFFADNASAADVSVTASTAGTALDPAPFRKAYQAVMGSAGAESFYIQLLDVPASGELYLDRSANRTGLLMTQSNVEGRLFACGTSRGDTIDALTYVPGRASSESVRYVASSTQGKPLFAGNIRFTATSVPLPSVDGLLVEYTCPPTGVSFKGSDFENLLGVNGGKVASVCFTPPSALYGTLYQGRTAVSAGTAITTNTYWLSVSSGTAGVNSINDVSFVPALSYTGGPISIPFDAISTTGSRSKGTVRITISSGTTNPGGSNPGTSNPGTTDPGTTLPAKTFSDVAANKYYYKQVTELTTSGVLNGYEDGTFRPDKTVTLGEALKMIMTSVGYPEQAATDSHWASGYLAKAKVDKLLPAGIIERLDRPVDRYTMAEITARAMGLTLSPLTVSPFADMAVNAAAAPAVGALHGIGVLIGQENSAKQMIYQGEYAIKRGDFAVIIWRVQNYVRTGNVNGTPAA